MLARENGWLECADVLRDWLLNKDKDLREREDAVGEDTGLYTFRDRQPSVGTLDSAEGSLRKRLQMKRSIDNAFNMLRPSATGLCDTYLRAHANSSASSTRNQNDPPSPAVTPLGEYTFYPVDSNSNEAISERRPSLPQIDIDVLRKSSSPNMSCSRRPRSAGNGAEPSQPSPQRSHSRKLGSKYSLLNMFKKGQASAEGAHANTSPIPTPEPSVTGFSSSNPIAIPAAGSSPSSSPNDPSSFTSRFRFRMGSDASMRGQAHVPLAVELHHALVQQLPHSRNLSASGVSPNRGGAVFDDDVIVVADGLPSTPPTRPGILRAHNRSSSSGHSQAQAQLGAKSSFRALRFDSSSSSASKTGGSSNHYRKGSNSSRSPTRRLKGTASINSLIHREDSPGSESRAGKELSVPDSAPSATIDFTEVRADLEEDEEEYGRPIQRPDDDVGTAEPAEPKSRLTELRTESRPRGESFASSSSSLSPILSPDATVVTVSAEFPFSINRPPPMDDLEQQQQQHLSVPHSGEGDNRLRGDSVSSMSTDGSNNPQLSLSGTTATSSGSVTTPVYSPSDLTSSGPALSSSHLKEKNQVPSEANQDSTTEDGYIASSDALNVGLQERRSHAPLDINIRSISSHAQAEALVQRAQQSILDMADHLPDEPTSAGLTSGRTPLSAKLAAYGESLAIERRLKKEEEEKEKRGKAGVLVGEDERTSGRSRTAVFARDQSGARGTSRGGKAHRGGLDRQFSLEHKSSRARSSSRVRELKRPSTSAGTSAENRELSTITPYHDPTHSRLSPDLAHDVPVTENDPRNHHHPSHSTSVVDSSKHKFLAEPFATADTPLSSQFSGPHAQRFSAETSEDERRSPMVRSRTPDPEPEARSQESSRETTGIPLCRVSTAPVQKSASNTSLPSRGKRELAKHMASANKLTRMGFSTAEGWQSTAMMPGAPRPPVANKARFGGLKSLVQSLKGKS